MESKKIRILLITENGNRLEYRNGDRYIALETENGKNNLLVEGDFNLMDLLWYLLEIHCIFGIDYISVYERRNWKWLLKYTKHYTDPNDPNQHYLRISENANIIKRLIEEHE